VITETGFDVVAFIVVGSIVAAISIYFFFSL